MNKSQNGQWDLLNSDDEKKNNAKDFDVLLLQEPYIDYLGNPKATRAWKLVKPTIGHDADGDHPRSIILVNSKIPTDHWEELKIENGNRDITAIQLSGTFGRLTIINVYNDQNHSRTFRIIDAFIVSNREKILSRDDDYLIIGGDFNRHHPLWESDDNGQLLTAGHLEKARQIISTMEKFDLEQILPKGIPTFHSKVHNSWTRPDNVICSSTLTTSVLVCDVATHAITGPGIDHLPIHLILDLQLPNIKPKPRLNFRNTSWTDFDAKLKENLNEENLPEIIHDEPQFHDSVTKLTHSIQKTIDEVVEKTKPFPLSKRWWNAELAAMKKSIRRLGADHYRYRTLPDHPSHDIFRQESNRYSEYIKKQKARHWEQYLANALDEDASTLNFFISEPPTDGGGTRIPTLKYNDKTDGRHKEASTNEEKTTALTQAFFPPKPLETHVPEDYEYPEPINYPCVITEKRVAYQINRLSPYKAPGPDGIPNAVWTHCKTTLVPILTRIFKASMALKIHSPSWKEWTTVVLRKPGKPRYDNPKAWRPIALMNTMGKILTALIAEDLSYMCEKHQLIPDRHFGGRPGRTTTDAIHLLTHRIKAAWRKGKVVSVLFLDIEGAFPNATLAQLTHGMKKRRIPDAYVQFTERQLGERRTKLSFDDYTSDWISIDNGIGQGDPKSMYDYVIYNSDLIDKDERTESCAKQTVPIPKSARERGTQEKEEDAAAFVDDAWILGEGNTFEEANATIQDMMEREGGGLDWSRTHNSKFELTKTIYVGFTNKRIPCPFRRKKTIPMPRPPLKIGDAIIEPSPSTRYLGIKIDQELKWAEQAKATIEKATKWTLAFRRMAQPSKGLTAKIMLKLYKTVLIPKISYGIDTWYRPITMTPNGKKRTGSVGVLKQLTKIQRIAAIAITGAFRSTATDILEVHAGLHPMEITMHRACQRAALRMATLPKTHPLSTPIKRSAKRILKRHASPLHYIMALCPHEIETMEKITPIRRAPDYSVPSKIRIAMSREESKTNETTDQAEAKIYSDGSSLEGGVGASAVMIRANRPTRALRYHLGPATRYTVANAEAVGMCLAIHLVSNPSIILPKTVTFYIDSQATIRGIDVKRPKPGQYLILHFLDALDRLKRRHSGIRTKIVWITAHDGVEGNELADEEAKAAARGASSNRNLLPKIFRDGPLPISATATKQQLNNDMNTKWKTMWGSSPRYRRLRKLDKNAPDSKFTKKTKGFPRKHTSLITQLRTGHIALQDHLYRINRADTPQCLSCLTSAETIEHYLLDCPTHRRARFLLKLKAGRNARNLEYLLNTPKGMKQLIQYIGGTNRFHQTYGDIQIDDQEE